MSSPAKRPVNPPSRMAHERYIVTVDGQAKRSFAVEEDARREADRISTGYPNVVVIVQDGDRHLIRDYPDEAPIAGLAETIE